MNTLPRSAKVAAQALLSGVLVLAAAIVPAQAAKSSQSYPILVFQGGLQPLVRNFNPFAPWAAQPEMQALIYEPLYEIDNVQFREYPWLATSYTWSTDLTTLTFTIRHGVRWSDGTPFTANDVYFTF